MDHQDYDAGPAPPFGEPSPTPPPQTDKQMRQNRQRRLLPLAVLIVVLGLGLWVYAVNAPDGPTGAARVRANCQFQYPNDKAAAEACAGGGRRLNDLEAERVRGLH